MHITISVKDSSIMLSEQQSAVRKLVKGTAFILSDNYDFATSCRIVYCVTIIHSTVRPLTRRIAVGSDKPYLSNKIRTFCVKNEFTAVISVRISVNKMWFLCPVLVYYELAPVPKTVSSIPQSFPSARSQHRLILSAKKSLVHAGQRNVLIHLM